MSKEKNAPGAAGAGTEAAEAASLNYDHDTTHSSDGQDPAAGNGKGFQSPNYTQIPNDLLGLDNDPGYMKDMSLCELKVVLAICRLTFGFHRYNVKRSLPILENMTGLSIESIRKGAKAAEERGLIKRISKHGRGLISEWEVVFSPLEKSDQLWNDFMALFRRLNDEERAAFLEKAKNLALLESEENGKGQKFGTFPEKKAKNLGLKGQDFSPHERNYKETEQEGKETEQQQGKENFLSVVENLLIEFGIVQPALNKILELAPEEATVKAWIDYTLRQRGLENPAGYVASRLIAGDPPPNTPPAKKRWYSDEDYKRSFVQPGDEVEGAKGLGSWDEVEGATGLGPKA